ncbi:MAG: 1-acyl-sn-glycerol-3-phosphate acyltransferase [Bryobacteraceae bacterium]|nr:1-acyl-sn-glycerol-3-phosphate acyltransferase [Bryobacteraceae bacterium]
MLATVVMGTISVAASFFDREGRFTDRVARRWARMLLAIGRVRVRVRGAEHLQPGCRYVLAGNHLSLMDTPVVLANVPIRFLFLVNEKYVRIPFLGTHLRRTGHFSVNMEEDVRASLRSMTEAAAAVRQRGVSILLFPEGTRATGPMGEFKEGAVYIAIKAGVPLVPFAICGTREVLPVGSIQVRGGDVDLVFGEPMSTDGHALKDRSKLNRMLYDRVAALRAELESR